MNRFFVGFAFVLIACMLAAAPLHAQTNVNWIIPPVDQDFGNPSNWTDTVDSNAWLHVNAATVGEWPILSSGHPSVYGLYLGETASGELDITNAALDLSYAFRMGLTTNPDFPSTSTLKLSGAALTQLDPGGGWGESVRIGMGNGATANIVMENNSVMSFPRSPSVSFGRDAGAIGNLTMTDSTLITATQADGSAWQWVAAIGRDGGTSTANLTNSNWNHYGSSIQVGMGDDSDGTLNLRGSSAVLIKPQIDSSFSDGILFIGVGYFVTATVNMYDTSTITLPNEGALSCGNSGAMGILQMQDHTSLTCASGEIGVNGGEGTVVLSGSSALTITSGSALVLGGNGNAELGGTGYLTLNDTSTVTAPGVVLGNEGTGTLSFNGGTLKASANSADFLQIVTSGLVEIKEGGGTINVDTDGLSQPLTVTIAATVALAHGGSLATDGGLTKTGVGTLIYNGSGDYTGPTLVNEGTFGGAAYLPWSGCVLGSGGTLAPGDPNSTNSALFVASLDASAGGKIINAIDCSVANGTCNTLEIWGDATLTNTHFAPEFVGGLPSGSYTLLTASGTLTASGLVLDAAATVPNTRQTLDLSPVDNTVVLTATGAPLTDTWTGAASGIWNANGAANWVNDGTDLKFMNWDHVAFLSTDSQPLITLNEHVYVSDMYFSGANNYVISGTGKITGVSDVLGGPLTLFTPPTETQGSVDIQTNGNVFAAINVVSGSLAFTNGANNADALFVHPGAVMALNGTGRLDVKADYGDYVLVGFHPGNSAKLELKNSSAFTVGRGSAVIGKDGGDGTLEMTGSSTWENLPNDWGWCITFVGLNPGARGTLTMGRGTDVNENPSLMVDTGILSVGNSGGEGVITAGHYATIRADSVIEFGVNGGSATVDLYDHASMSAHNNINISDSEGTATVTMHDQSSMTVDDGVCFIGVYGGNGTLNMSGGTSPADPGSHLQVNGTLSCGNSPGGTGLYGQAAITMSGYSSVYARDGFEIGTNGGSGTLDASGHAAIVIGGGGFRLGSWGGGGIGTATLSESSSITTDFVLLGDDGISGTLYLNGGTLRPTQNHTDFINKPNGSVYVCEGGATFDVGTDGGGVPLVVGGIGIELLHGYLGPDDVPDGGVTKTGVGTLILTAAPTYTGNTDIQDGMLQFAVPGDVALTTVTGSDTGTLSVCDGTTLTAISIQVGSLSIGGSPVPFPGSAMAVPEPSTMFLLVLAGIGLLFQARRKFRA